MAEQESPGRRIQVANARPEDAGRGLARIPTAVMAELPALKLERAEFIVLIETDAEKPGPDGIDRVEFHVRP